MASGRHRNTFRFAVGDPDGPRTRTWVVFTGSDGSLYIATRGLARHLKASLHASGNWRSGLTTEGAAAHPGMRSPTGDRAFAKYTRPAPLGDGATIGFTVIVPGSELRVPPNRELETKKVAWLPAPGEGRVAQVAIAFVPCETPPDRWPAKARGMKLLHRFDLPDESALVIYHDRDETPDEHVRWHALRRQFREVLDLRGESDPSETTEYAALVEGAMDHRGPYYLDLNIR